MKKKFKGFTLIELIIVMAIFSVIMFAAFQLIGPIGKQFSSTSQYEGARATLDNVKRYLDGTIRYADKVYVCRDTIANMDTNVQLFYDNLYKDNLSSETDNVYVLEFNNTNFGTTSSPMSLYTYPVSSGTLNISGKTTNTSPVNKALFDEYALRFCLGQYEYKYDSSTDTMILDTVNTSISASDFCVTCDLYKNTTSGPKALEQCMSMPVSFVNINNSNNLSKQIVTETSGSSVSYKYQNIDSTDVFKFIDNVSTPTKYDDFYIIYTIPKKL